MDMRIESGSMNASQTPGISIYPVQQFRRTPVESVPGVERRNFRTPSSEDRSDDNRSTGRAADVQTYSRKGLGDQSPKLGWNLDLLA